MESHQIHQRRAALNLARSLASSNSESETKADWGISMNISTLVSAAVALVLASLSVPLLNSYCKSFIHLCRLCSVSEREHRFPCLWMLIEFGHRVRLVKYPITFAIHDGFSGGGFDSEKRHDIHQWCFSSLRWFYGHSQWQDTPRRVLFLSPGSFSFTAAAYLFFLLF